MCVCGQMIGLEVEGRYEEVDCVKWLRRVDVNWCV
jgi:hypothetical protein